MNTFSIVNHCLKIDLDPLNIGVSLGDKLGRQEHWKKFD